MPDLEQHIAGWRADLLRAMPHRQDAVLELEEHLRDQIADLVKSGMAPEAAFATAVKWIGESPALAGEFSSALGPERERSWPVICVYGGLGLLFAALILVQIVPYSYGLHSLREYVILSTIVAGHLSVFGMGALSFCVLVTSTRRSLSERKRADSWHAIARLAVISAALLVIGIFADPMLAPEGSDRVFAWSSIQKGPLPVLFALVILLVTQVRNPLPDPLRRILMGLGIALIALGMIGDLSEGAPLPFVWLFFSSFILAQIALMQLRPTSPHPMRTA